MSLFGKKTPAVTPAWHPDFRDPATLPDVKPVRTSFFINGMAILALGVVGIYLGVQEYGRHNLGEEIRVLEARVEEHNARNNEVLKLHRSFQGEERYIDEVAQFLGGSLPVSELLVALSETLYPGMTLSVVRLEDVSERGRVVGQKLQLHGAVRANPDVAAGAMTEYLNAFHAHPFLEGMGVEAVPTSLVPARDGDQMAFGIEVRFNKAKKEGEK